MLETIKAGEFLNWSFLQGWQEKNRCMLYNKLKVSY